MYGVYGQIALKAKDSLNQWRSHMRTKGGLGVPKIFEKIACFVYHCCFLFVDHGCFFLVGVYYVFLVDHYYCFFVPCRSSSSWSASAAASFFFFFYQALTFKLLFPNLVLVPAPLNDISYFFNVTFLLLFACVSQIRWVGHRCK